MRYRPFTLLLCSTVLASTATEKPPASLFLPPLDTTVVKLDSSVSTATLAEEKVRRNGPSPSALVAQQFYPRFGAAFALAIRHAEVVDSSAAGSNGFDTARTAPDYTLAIGYLSLAQTSKTVARQFVAPSPPAFDPATGQMTPGLHRGYSEGPGIVSTLTATVAWTIRDRAADTALAHGTAVGSASFRGEARKAHWDEAARELAKNILYQTRFAPPR
jgi:hypothetical protein